LSSENLDDDVSSGYTLGGHVPSDGDTSQAASIATSFADGQVVSNQIDHSRKRNFKRDEDQKAYESGYQQGHQGDEK
jgi:hypothetical protein